MDLLTGSRHDDAMRRIMNRVEETLRHVVDSEMQCIAHVPTTRCLQLTPQPKQIGQIVVGSASHLYPPGMVVTGVE